MAENLIAFLAGAVVMGNAIAGLFFLRFWVKMRDGLFLAFAGAFWLLTFQGLAVFLQFPNEPHSALYLIRLAAFLLIIGAVFSKNRDRFGRGRE